MAVTTMLLRFPVVVDNICVPQTLDSRLTRRSANSCRKSSSVFFTEQSKLPAFAWNGTQNFWKVAASQNAGPTSSSDETKEDLASKLAAAEAEAEALRKELAARRADQPRELSKMKPTPPVRRIDGTGFRETMFGGISPTGKPEQQMSKWGLSEAEMFLSKDSPSEGMVVGLGGAAKEEGADAVVARRLVIGAALTAATVALSLWKLPTQFKKPSKPLFFYLVPLLRLQSTLLLITSDASLSDPTTIATQLNAAVGPADILRENLLSAASLFEEGSEDGADKLAFEILEYLDQADFSKYFENRGQPSPQQQVASEFRQNCVRIVSELRQSADLAARHSLVFEEVGESMRAEFLAFSLQSVQATLKKLKAFLKLAPKDALEAANLQLSQFSI